MRGPPQAEQDMEVGVFCRVHLKQSQVRSFISGSSGCLLLCRQHGSVIDGRRRPEQLLERRARGWPSAAPRGASSALKPQSEQVRLSAVLLSVHRGQVQRGSSLLEPCHIQRALDPSRGASQMEQRRAPAAFRKVQHPQAHWLLCMGTEPEEKLRRRRRRRRERGEEFGVSGTCCCEVVRTSSTL